MHILNCLGVATHRWPLLLIIKLSNVSCNWEACGPPNPPALRGGCAPQTSCNTGGLRPLDPLHKCTMIIAHAYTMIILHACTTIILRGFTMIIVSVCTMTIGYASSMIIVLAYVTWSYCMHVVWSYYMFRWIKDEGFHREACLETLWMGVSPKNQSSMICWKTQPKTKSSSEASDRLLGPD